MEPEIADSVPTVGIWNPACESGRSQQRELRDSHVLSSNEAVPIAEYLIGNFPMLDKHPGRQAQIAWLPSATAAEELGVA